MNDEMLKEKMDQLGRMIYQLEMNQREFEEKNNELINGIDELKTELKEFFLERKESLTSQCLIATYRKGAVKWDTKWLDGYSIDHPEILKYRKVAPPTVAFRIVEEGWENEGWTN